jgi:phosphate transport system substrate-binding protein
MSCDGAEAMIRARWTLACLLLLIAPSASSLSAESRLTIGGAQSLAPLAEKFSARYKETHPGIEIEIRRGSSNYVIAAIERGDIQVGLAARNLTAAEAARLRAEAMGYDAILLLSYSWNTVKNLSLEQLREIYSGKLTNWRDIGGEDKGIVPLTREAGSGVHTMFVETLFGKAGNGIEKAFVLRASKDKILRTVKRVRGSIGYGIVSLEEAETEGVKVLSIDGRGPTAENIRQGLYRFTRPQLLVTRAEPDPPAREWMRGFVEYVKRGDRPR